MADPEAPEFRIVIPARYASQRLPGKPLRDINGKTMIEWVYLAASQAGALEVVVATDDQRIADEVSKFGGKACMTSSEHQSGTDRILEVAQINAWSAEQIVVNLQGDEPLMPAANMTQVARILAEGKQVVMTTNSPEYGSSEFFTIADRYLVKRAGPIPVRARAGSGNIRAVK